MVFTVYLAAYFTNAMTPERSPDGTAYHLGLVARYLREHGFRRITTNMYANLSQGVEMLHLFAFAFGRHSAAALVHFGFLATLPLAMLCYARRFAFPAAEVAEAYTSRDILVAYQSACNEVTRDILWTPVVEYFRPQRHVPQPLGRGVGLRPQRGYAVAKLGGTFLRHVLHARAVHVE